MSVSSRKPKKKRNAGLTSWRKKLDEEGLQYVDECRRAKLEAAQIKPYFLDRIIANAMAASSATNESTDYAKLIGQLKAEDSSVAEKIESQVRDAFSSISVPSVKELWTVIFRALEQSGPQGRRALAILPAMLIHWLWGSYQDVRRRHFANAVLTDRQFFWVLGTAIQNIGAPFKTGKLDPTTKGRINAELLEAIPTIRSHQKVRLSYRELKDALQYMRIYISNEDQLRLFVHRAKRKNWL